MAEHIVVTTIFLLYQQLHKLLQNYIIFKFLNYTITVILIVIFNHSIIQLPYESPNMPSNPQVFLGRAGTTFQN